MTETKNPSTTARPAGFYRLTEDVSSTLLRNRNFKRDWRQWGAWKKGTTFEVQDAPSPTALAPQWLALVAPGVSHAAGRLPIRRSEPHEVLSDAEALARQLLAFMEPYTPTSFYAILNTTSDPRGTAMYVLHQLVEQGTVSLTELGVLVCDYRQKLSEG